MLQISCRTDILFIPIPIKISFPPGLDLFSHVPLFECSNKRIFKFYAKYNCLNKKES